MSTTAWKATPQQVERVIAAVQPHACTDPYLPMINCIRLEIDGLRFLATATDRYSLGVCRADLSDWDEEAEPVEKVTAALRSEDLKRLFAFLRPQRTSEAEWTLTDDGLTVEAGTGESLRLRTVEVDHFPDWRAILGGVAEREPSTFAPMGFTPAIVDHFHKSAKILGERHATWHFVSPLKPVLVRIGADFLGLLMPARVPDEYAGLTLDSFGIESPKAVTAA